MMVPAFRVACRALAILAPLIAALPTQAGIVNLVSQARSVSVHSFVTGTPDQLEQAPDFGPFDAQVGFPRANAIADQHSTLTLIPDGAVFNALSNVRGSSDAAALGSSFHVAFDLTRPADYTLTYTVGASGAGDDVIPTATFITPSATRDIHLGANESAVLQPGPYQLQIDDTGGKNITYVLNLTIIPLPPALWTTLAMLPALLFAITRLSKHPAPITHKTPPHAGGRAQRRLLPPPP